MKLDIKYVYPQYNKFWFQRRPPKKLHHILGTKIIRINLHTGDLSVAMTKRDAICAEWDGMLKTNTPHQSYKYFQDYWTRTNADLHETESPLINPDILDELDYERENKDGTLAQTLPYDRFEKVMSKFSIADQASFHALQNLNHNSEPPDEFSYSLRDGLTAIIAEKEGTVSKDHLAKFASVVDVFVGKGQDRSLYDIRKPEIVQWVSTLIKQGMSNSTINTHLSTLASNYTLAADWGRIADDRVNPFKKIKLPSKVVSSYKFMSDDMLREVLTHLDSRFHIQAILARNIGCRLSEMFKSTIETHEGIACLNMVEGKNGFSSRLVPIPLFMVDEVRATKDAWPSAGHYGDKFSKAKKKVTSDSQLAFHSLRGSFITHAGREGYPEQTIAWLVGHSDGKGSGHTGQTYFKGYTLQKMLEVVEKTPQYRAK